VGRIEPQRRYALRCEKYVASPGDTLPVTDVTEITGWE
jgi:hypothetical protein